MKQITGFIFLLFIGITLSSAGVHKFYVAVFNMEYVPQKKVVQMTSRVFIDDLEAAFLQKYKKRFYLGTSREMPEAKEFIAQYFTEKVIVKVNGSIQQIKFLGKETDDDVMVCYYTIPAKKGVADIQMKNTVLFELFPEQQNIIHTNINNNRKSLLLTNEKREGQLEFK